MSILLVLTILQFKQMDTPSDKATFSNNKMTKHGSGSITYCDITIFVWNATEKLSFFKVLTLVQKKVAVYS